MTFLMLQVTGAIPSTPWQMIVNASTMTKAVLVLLALLSLLSWTIIFAKWWQFRSERAASRAFMREFTRSSRLDQVVALAKRSRPSAMTRILTRATDFLSQGTREPGAAPAVAGSRVEALRLVLDSETAGERDRVASFIPTLGTIGSVSPLIGLLGTVLGVIEAFIGIATKGSGNIGAVAPGVAEALVATAAALTVAIPAVFGYNMFATRLNRFEGELDAFGTEIIAMLVRDGLI